LLPSFDEFALEQLNIAVAVNQMPESHKRFTVGRDLSYMGLIDPFEYRFVQQDGPGDAFRNKGPISGLLR
jgi:hypothetical protein